MDAQSSRATTCEISSSRRETHTCNSRSRAPAPGEQGSIAAPAGCRCASFAGWLSNTYQVTLRFMVNDCGFFCTQKIDGLYNAINTSDQVLTGLLWEQNALNYSNSTGNDKCACSAMHGCRNIVDLARPDHDHDGGYLPSRWNDLHARMRAHVHARTCTGARAPVPWRRPCMHRYR